MFSWMYVFLIWFVEYIDKFKEFKCRMLYVFDKILVDKCYYIFIIIFCIMIYIVKIYLIFF